MQNEPAGLGPQQVKSPCAIGEIRIPKLNAHLAANRGASGDGVGGQTGRSSTFSQARSRFTAPQPAENTPQKLPASLPIITPL